MIYDSFFGFNEEPFGVTPDPKFLYMSKHHEEAIAHLRFGITQNKGFVMLTGEIGSGKTTIIRYLLNSLEAGAHSALILNPKVNPFELLKLINNDFGISGAAETFKELMDGLNGFLLECFENGQMAVLIIDEAQDMSVECLEFMRLLSNIETDTSKLLQVILVGQPELREIVGTDRLRQLDQRIAVRYHLESLDMEDTKKYIMHRLKVAGSGMIVFPDKGMKNIFEFSRGIPRLINLFCDRTLMAAYAKGDIKISASLIKDVLREISKEYATEKKGGRFSLKPLLAGAAFLLIATLFMYSALYKDDYLLSLRKKPVPDIFIKNGIFLSHDAETGEKTGFLNLLSIFGEERLNASLIEEEIKKRGYSIYRFQDISKVMKFKLPAILKFDEAGQAKYVVLRWIVGEDTLVIDPIAGETILPLEELKKRTKGIQLIYKNKYNSAERLKKLEEALKELGFFNYAPKGDFGPKARKALMEFQETSGIKKTGRLDEETAILLSRDSHTPSIVP